MSGRAPRFEVVHNPGEAQPWWGRYVAKNGRIRWTTENYTRRSGAIRAIEDITGHAVYADENGLHVTRNLRTLEVRLVVEP